MEIIAHLHQTKSVLSNLEKSKRYTDYTMIKPKSDCYLKSVEKLNIDLNQSGANKKLLVIDLDETLIHVSKDINNCAFTIPIKLRNGTIVRVTIILFFSFKKKIICTLAWSALQTVLI